MTKRRTKSYRTLTMRWHRNWRKSTRMSKRKIKEKMMKMKKRTSTLTLITWTMMRRLFLFSTSKKSMRKTLTPSLCLRSNTSNSLLTTKICSKEWETKRALTHQKLWSRMTELWSFRERTTSMIKKRNTNKIWISREESRILTMKNKTMVKNSNRQTMEKKRTTNKILKSSTLNTK